MAYDSSNFKPQVDEVGQIILKARELLSDPARWLKGQLRCGTQVCAVGALCEALGIVDYGFASQSPLSEPALLRVIRALPEGYQSVPGFNDADETTHADVLALLDRAALSGASK